MIAMIVAVAAVEAPRFAPPDGVVLHCTLDDTRSVAGEARRFGLRRRVVFRRAGDGWTAEVVLVEIRTDRDDPVARRYRAGVGGLSGVTLRYRITADGRVTGLDDEAAVWAAWRRGITGMVGAKGRAADPLAVMSAGQRRALMHSMIAPVLGMADLTLATGESRVRVPADDGRAALDGVRVVRDGVPGRRMVATHAASADGSVVIDRERVIDTATGLVLRESEVRRMTIGDAVETVRSNMALTP